MLSKKPHSRGCLPLILKKVSTIQRSVSMNTIPAACCLCSVPVMINTTICSPNKHKNFPKPVFFPA